MRVALIFAMAVAYAGVFILAEPHLGPLVGVAGFFWVGITGFLLGRAAGVGAAILLIPLNFFLYTGFAGWTSGDFWKLGWPVRAGAVALGFACGQIGVIQARLVAKEKLVARILAERQHLIDRIDTGIVIHAADGSIVALNPAAARLLGYRDTGVFDRPPPDGFALAIPGLVR